MLERALAGAILAALLGAAFGPPAVARDQADLFGELAGTWVWCEYDGLFPRCEEITWLADGSLNCSGCRGGQPGGRRFFAAVEKWTDPDGSVNFKAVESAGEERCCLLIRISPGGSRLEMIQSPFPAFPRTIDPAAAGYRCYLRKKIYRGTPRFRLDRDQATRLAWSVSGSDGGKAGYPFSPHMVKPCTKCL